VKGITSAGLMPSLIAGTASDNWGLCSEYDLQ